MIFGKIISFALALTAMGVFGISASASENTVAYVPLDDRPGNLQRVLYAAGASGIELLTPDEELIHTCLDNQPRNASGRRFGDTDAVLSWINTADKQTDNFIISLDQLLSGGLVNSRVGGKINREKEVIDRIIKLSKTNNVYVFDTVVRIAACTVGYNGADVKMYDYFRTYFDRSADEVYQTLTSKYVQEIVTAQTARQRKLELIKYMLQKDKENKIKYYIGVDDSSSRDNIQRNEIAQIRQWLNGRGTVYSGTDEVGIMMLSDMAVKIHHEPVNVCVRYFGGNEDSGTEYDFDTVKENTQSHLEGSGAVIVDDVSQADAQVFVMTLHDENGTQAQYTKELFDAYDESPVPVMIVDTAETEYDYEEKVYHKDLVKMLSYIDTYKLLSFSSWNGGGNAIGMAIGNGVSRMAYLKKFGTSSEQVQEQYEKELVFSFAKDIGYKMMNDGAEVLLSNYLTARGYSTSDFYAHNDEVVWAMNNGVLERCMNRSVESVGACIRGIEDGKIIYDVIDSITLSNYRAPWYRTFEINFDIDVESHESNIRRQAAQSE